jgi:WD40 repeat protein
VEGRRLRVFHISDLHMRSVEGPQAERARLEAAFRWRVLGEKWAANLAELRRDGVPFDLVVFTGDLGDWGHPTDYPRACALLKQTCAALDVPLDRLFVIPGNHDIDRTIQRAAWESLRREVAKDPRAYSRWMAGEDRGALRGDGRRDQILERQQAFWSAVATEFRAAAPGSWHSPHGRLGYRHAVTLPGLSQPIQVIGLDTAWLAGDEHDGGELRLTEHQVALLTTTASGEPLPGFRIALMHHRLADLADAADARRLMADRVDVLLHGHQHEPAAEVLQGPDHQLLVLATGCLYEGDEEHRYANTCQVIDLELDEQARPRGAQVRFRGWSARALFWGDDALLYERARGGWLRLDRGARGWRFDEGGDVTHAHAPSSQTPAVSRPSPASSARAGLIDFTLERQRHRRFVGREDVLAQLDQWLLGPGEARWVMVTGGPGMGKSAILSAWLARREAAGTVVAHHFVRRQVADWDQPEVIAASLAAQIEAMFPELRDPEAKPEGRLIELFGRVSKHLSASKHLGASERLVVVVDGLDEARAEPSENPLPRFLPHSLPDGIRLLCAMRPTYPHLSWIEARNPARRIDLDDSRWAASNEAVVRGFWEAVATEYEPPLLPETIAAAIASAEGNVLHAVMLHDALQDMPAAGRRVDRIPHGLAALIGEVWDRATSHDSVRAMLGLLCAAQEALSLDMLTELAGCSYDEKRRFVREARQLLLEEPASWAGVKAYRPRHDWVRELIAEQLGVPTMRTHHWTLSRKLATWPAPVEPTARRYALRHALLHRVEAGEWADAWRLAADMSFLEAKCRELGAHEAEAEVAWAAERCRANGDSVLCQHFEDLARALVRESHWLRTAPEAIAALVWNRLRRSGWEAEDLDAQLTLPGEATFPRVRYAATRENPALIRNLVGHSDSVNACAVTPDGRRVVSASSDGTLKIWDLDSGRVLVTMKGHTDEVRACEVTADGRRVISASADGTLKIWDLEDHKIGRALATLQGHADWVNACAVTRDGERVISASDDGTLKIWELGSGTLLATLEGHTASVKACAVTADGQRVVSASCDGTLRVWDLKTGCELATLEGHTGWVLSCAVTADNRVVSASHDKKLRVWDLNTGYTLTTLEGHSDWIRACVWMADGRRVVSASDDRTLRVWDLDSRHVHATLEGHADQINGCAVTANGRYLVSASNDETLKVWDLNSAHTLATLDGHTHTVNACVVTADGQRVVSASQDGTLKIWDTDSGRVLATLQSPFGGVNTCAVTRNGRRVVSASEDGRLYIWSLDSGRRLTTLEGHAEQVLACAVTPDGHRVVSASEDRTLKVWDLVSGRRLATLKGHDGRVNACAMTVDGRRVVSASWDGTLKVWALENGRTLATLKGHAAGVNACAVTVDGRRVISASLDQTLKVWDLDNEHVLATLEGHTGGVHACAVMADSSRIVSASFDRTLKVWDLETHACIFTHHGDVAYTAVAASATAIFAGDATGAVWFLDWPSSNRGERSRRGSHGQRSPSASTGNESPSPRSLMKKHTILFLAANPFETAQLALDRQARAIQKELESAGFRDRFELVTRWAVEPLDLLRELRKLKPTVVHFSGHGGQRATSDRRPGREPAPRRDIVGKPDIVGNEQRHGLFFQGADGRAQFVSAQAIEETFGAAGSSVKLVVLNACYSDVQADALLTHIDCVVGMSGSIRDEAARSFAIGFYGGLGERESVAAAYKQGRAAISLEGLPDSERPQLKVRAGADATQLVLAAAADPP